MYEHNLVRYDSPEKCRYVVNLWLTPVSATGAGIDIVIQNMFQDRERRPSVHSLYVQQCP